MDNDTEKLIAKWVAIYKRAVKTEQWGMANKAEQEIDKLKKEKADVTKTDHISLQK